MSTTPELEPATNDARLIEEAISRVCRSQPVPDAHRNLIRTRLGGELDRGRRDLFSLVRVARKILDEI